MNGVQSLNSAAAVPDERCAPVADEGCDVPPLIQDCKDPKSPAISSGTDQDPAPQRHLHGVPLKLPPPGGPPPHLSGVLPIAPGPLKHPVEPHPETESSPPLE